MIKALQILLFAAIAGLLAISLTGMLGFAIWQSEMITPFRPQLLIVSLAGLGLSLTFKSKPLIWLAILTVVSNAAPIATRLAERKSLAPVMASAAPTRHVRMVLSNVLCDNQQYDRVISMVRTERPDLFVAIETTPDWIRHLEALKADYPYAYAPPKLGLLGITVYAKRPFKAELIGLGPRQAPLVRLDFGDFILFAAHPMPPARKRIALDNRLYLSELALRVEAETRPVILAGDLNATLWSANMAPLLRARMQWPQGSGLAYSWPSSNPLLAIQIDHVLTKGFKGGTYRVLAPVGSDHFPVRADLDL